MQCKRLLPVIAALALLILVVAACGGETTPCPTAEACPPAANVRDVPDLPRGGGVPNRGSMPGPGSLPNLP